jgi:hypothetical protein
MEALAHVVEDVVGQQRLLEEGEVRHQELEREAGVVREQLERVTLRWQEVESLNEDMRLERAREALEREQEQEAREREATDIVLLREEARDLRFEQQQEQERQHATAMLEQQAAAAHMLQQQEMQQRETLQQLQGELQQLQARLEEEREEARVRTEELAETLRARDEEVARERAAAEELSARLAECERASALLDRERQARQDVARERARLDATRQTSPAPSAAPAQTAEGVKAVTALTTATNAGGEHTGAGLSCIAQSEGAAGATAVTAAALCGVQAEGAGTHVTAGGGGVAGIAHRDGEEKGEKEAAAVAVRRVRGEREEASAQQAAPAPAPAPAHEPDPADPAPQPEQGEAAAGPSPEEAQVSSQGAGTHEQQALVKAQLAASASHTELAALAEQVRQQDEAMGQVRAELARALEKFEAARSGEQRLVHECHRLREVSGARAARGCRACPGRLPPRSRFVHLSACLPRGLGQHFQRLDAHTRGRIVYSHALPPLSNPSASPLFSTNSKNVRKSCSSRALRQARRRLLPIHPLLLRHLLIYLQRALKHEAKYRTKGRALRCPKRRHLPTMAPPQRCRRRAARLRRRKTQG